ncbi:MAG: translation initiation factor eIF-2B [Candidatus Helarchaeota archaeon]
MPVIHEVSKLIKKIKEDKQSGAAELTEKVKSALLLQVQKSNEKKFELFIDDLEKLIKVLMKTRPYMAPLLHAFKPLLKILNDPPTTLQALKTDLINALNAQNILSAQNRNQLMKNAQAVLEPASSVMTLSYSSTVLEVFRKTPKRLRIYVLESRPLNEGIKTAEMLSHLNKHDITVLVDAAMGQVMPVDLILTGADSILKDGSFINKVGTFPLAVMAREFRVPFHVITESSKFNILHYFGKELLIEENDPGEILPKQETSIKVINKYFEMTPAKYVTSIVSEYGVLSPENFIQKVESQKELELFKKYLFD